MANTELNKATAIVKSESGGTFSKVIDTLVKNFPLEWVLPVVFMRILNTIKNPNSQSAKALEKVLIPFGRALVEKYPQIVDE